MPPEAFAAFFERATGYPPYDFQRELGERRSPPDIIQVPTGAGKTLAVLLPWLSDAAAPRRLVYALPMRALVEQTARVLARRWSGWRIRRLCTC